MRRPENQENNQIKSVKIIEDNVSSISIIPDVVQKKVAEYWQGTFDSKTECK